MANYYDYYQRKSIPWPTRFFPKIVNDLENDFVDKC